MSEKEKKGGKVTGKWCSLCGERVADYTKDGKLVCSGCKEFSANMNDSFQNFTFKDCISSVLVKGFHPSPLDI
jgi:phosphoenolpyruvate-protein kinase (PTS system EI component)